MRLIVVTPPRRRRRSALLLLILSLAFLACVLGFAGARTALAQEGEPKPGEPKPGEPKAPPQTWTPIPPQGPTVTASCDSTLDTVTVRGTGWKSTALSPAGLVELRGRFTAPSHDFVHKVSTQGDEVFESQIYIYHLPEGTGLVIEANQPMVALSAMTSTACQPGGEPTPPPPPPPELPELTASCDLDPTTPSQRVISWEGTGWPLGEQVDILVRGADEPAGAEEPLGTGGVDGSFAGSSVYRGGKNELVLEGRSYRATVETTVACPVQEPPGGGGTTTPDGGGGSDGGSDGGVIPPIGDVFSGLLAGRLPDTGGGWAILLIAGAILIAFGWLLVRLARRFAA